MELYFLSYFFLFLLDI